MKPRRQHLLLAVAAGLVASASCTTHDAAGPSYAPSLTETSASALPPVGKDQLKAKELEEKARVAAAGEASKPIYDALKPEWDRIVTLYPNGNTGRWGPVYCEPLQYASDVRIIGPEGGDLSIGPHKLSIPKGALTGHAVITVEMPVSMAVTVRLSPEGLVFAKHLRLSLSYQHCLGPIDHRGRVALSDGGLTALEFPDSDWTGDGLVTAWLAHFSRYAVMY
jgi:hypothetical protein